MYGGILNFLIAIAIQALAPRARDAVWNPLQILLMVGIPALALLLGRFWFRRIMARALHDDASFRRLRSRFSQVVQLLQSAMLVPFALLLYTTDYPALIIAPASAISEMLGSVLGILPYVLLLCGAWWEAYPLQGVLLRQSGSRTGFVFSHARMELPVLVPWVVLMGIADLVVWLWPTAEARLQQQPVLQLLYAPLFLVLVGIFLPVLIKAMWGCSPIPDGSLRLRLEKLCSVLGLKVGEILYWPILEGQVLTAGIVGLLPRYRYLLVTPALAEILPPDEMSAVVAHEAGHVRHRHLWFYLFFFMGYVFVVTVFLRLTDLLVATLAPLHVWVGSPYYSAVVTVGLLGVLFVYFRVLFGTVSRAFERQADLYALEAIGTPAPLVSSLERISYYSGDIRDLPSWHHGSISERVTFLNRAGDSPELVRRHHHKVRRLLGFYAVAVLAAGVLAAATLQGPLAAAMDRYVLEQARQAQEERFSEHEKALMRAIREAPTESDAWFLLGNLYQEWDREAEAEQAYRRVIRRQPEHAEALNNLAWLYLTTENPDLYRPERALALAEMAVALRPVPHIWDTLAEARFRVHDRGGAVSASRAALAQDPANRPYYERQLKRFMEAARNP